MILADKVMCLRKQKGWSQEELANRMNVSRQSVSKWESDASVPEMDKIVLLSSIFNVSTDYLLKDDMLEDKNIFDDETLSIKQKVIWKREELEIYVNHLDRYSNVIGVAVVLCMLGVVNLIFFGGKSDYEMFGLETNVSIMVGLVGMFLLIGIAVAIFIVSDNSKSDFNIVEQNEVYIDNKLRESLIEIQQKYRAKYTAGITVGVVMCLFAAVPLIIGGLLEESDSNLISLVILLLLLVTIATYIFIRVSIKYDGYNKLLNQQTRSKKGQEADEITEQVSTIYWAVVVGIYLGWSFFTSNWSLTWIVWPVSGVLYAIIPSIINLKMKNK